MKIKIAVVQFETDPFSPAKNLLKAESFVKKAASAGAQVVVFPEDFAASFGLSDQKLVDFNEKFRRNFRVLAKKFSVDIVAGSLEQEKEKRFNTAYYIDSKGEIRGKYRKINLWLEEKKNISPGQEIVVFDTSYGKAGLIICWDLIFPELFRKMVKAGVEIVYCPSCWHKEDAGVGLKYDSEAEIKSIDALCTARAFENEIILVYANAAGKWQDGKKSEISVGHSQIAVPFKGALQKLNHNKEEMFIEEVDTAILKDAEKVYKIRADLKRGIL